MKCQICSKEFIKNSNVQKYCSIQCKEKRNYLVYKDKKKEKYLIKAKEKRNKSCSFCNSKYYDESKNNKNLYCSRKCQLKEYYQRYKNLEKNKILCSKYYLNNKEKFQKYNKEYRQKNQNKRECQYLVRMDKKRNPQNYPNECCICGIKENIEFHHQDYNFPLSVYPLCRTHHKQIHTNEVMS